MTKIKLLILGCRDDYTRRTVVWAGVQQQQQQPGQYLFLDTELRQPAERQWTRWCWHVWPGLRQFIVTSFLLASFFSKQHLAPDRAANRDRKSGV